MYALTHAYTQVWHLRITLHFLADAGNMLDCACLASIVALRHFRRPEVEVVGEDVVLVRALRFSMGLCVIYRVFSQHQPDERAPVPLAMHHTPFCFTFAFFHPPSSSNVDEVITILDPSSLEQTLCGGTMSVALNAQVRLPARDFFYHFSHFGPGRVPRAPFSLRSPRSRRTK